MAEVDENARRRDTAREVWLTQLTPEQRRDEEMAAEAEAGYDPEKLTPRLTGRPGLVGMVDSGRSDLASRAKNIVRGSDPDEGCGLLWAPTGEELVERILVADWHRDQCGCDALPRACTYAHLIPDTWTIRAVLDAFKTLQRAVQSGQQLGQDPAQ